MTEKHTPGPWYADAEGNIWRRPVSELYQNGGEVAGDRPLAYATRGFFGEGLNGYPVVANSRVLAAAPELLEALEAMLTECDPMKLNCGEPWCRARAAIAKARGTS